MNLSGKNAKYEPRYVPVEVKEFEYGFRVRYEEAEGDSWYRFRYWDKMKGIKIDSEDGIISEEIINGQAWTIRGTPDSPCLFSHHLHA